MDREKIEWIVAGALAIASRTRPLPGERKTAMDLVGAVVGSHVEAWDGCTRDEFAAACELFRERYETR